MPKPSSLVPDLTGRIVNGGQYQLVKKLGAGSFGVVYRSINLQAGSKVASTASSLIPVTVAIKVLPLKGMSERDVQRIHREVVIHHDASEHEGVVLLYDVFEDSQYFYMVMEFCPGGDLFGTIVGRDRKTGKNMLWREDEIVKNVFIQIIDALESMHKKLLYHRDLKADNILCDKSGTKVYIADFGLATSNPMSTRLGCGTSSYMSPGMCHKSASPISSMLTAAIKQNALEKIREDVLIQTPRATSGLWASSSST